MRRLAALLLVLLAACSAKAPRSTPTPTPSRTPSTDIHLDLDSAVRTLTHRPGTRVLKQIRGDMDGDGIPEVALWSEATASSPGSVLRQDYVDVWSFRSSAFIKVFSATDAITNDPTNVSQHVQFFQFVTFDGKPDLVLGVVNQGASAGPLDIWVWSWGTPALKQEFRYSTTVDGNLTASGKGLRLDTGSYKASDPMCCPSGMDHIVIGATGGKISIVSKTTTKS